MKTSLKLLFVFIATILLFTSCDKDFYEDVELQKNNLESIDVKTITYDEFKRKLKSVENKPAVKMILNNTNSIRHFARSGDDSEIEIFTDVIKEITSGTYKSYTMYIKTSDTIASKFYNLTLEEKEGNTDAFITKYSPTENWLDDKSQPFEGGITTFRVEPGPGGSIKFTHVDEEGGGEVEGSNIYPIACDGTVQTTIIVEAIMCSEFVHWPWSPTTPPCNASVKAKYKYTYRYECVPGITFPGSGGSNPGGSSPVGGNSPGSSQPGEPSNNSLTTIVGEPIIRPSVLYLADLLSLNSRQITFLSNNPVVEAQISNYISENTIGGVVSSEVKSFVLEFIQGALESGLNLDFEKSLKSPANIDFSAIDQNTPEGQQFTWIYSKLMESSVFKQMFTETFQVSDPRINVKFEVTDEGIPSGANGICKIQGSDGNWHNTIKIRKSIIGEDSNLSIAKTILHECIHAYLNIKKIDSNLGTTIAQLNGLDLGQLLGTFTGGFGGVPVANGTVTQHDFMFTYMLPVFTNVLADLKDDLILPSHIVEAEQAIWYLSNDEEYNFNWPDLYFYLSLNGLHGSAPFQNEFPTNSLNFEKYYFMQELGVLSLTKTMF
ncbi:hypothetical protein M0M57_05480 [Flavobacterium azooxidireducens]|uniref:SprT-like domain-containing protein n=1 Tax=Flavobacterium azooxidireducens TaxID=1871076 RepID=A0ABY4KM39_9FLAO|nr:hypothetical protein [Flavobacterium azooxidireducens]UPQ80287.1 hypothetical protein M0M57_05480 [Flavobacterium azooxidireducens]